MATRMIGRRKNYVTEMSTKMKGFVVVVLYILIGHRLTSTKRFLNLHAPNKDSLFTPLITIIIFISPTPFHCLTAFNPFLSNTEWTNVL